MMKVHGTFGGLVLFLLIAGCDRPSAPDCFKTAGAPDVAVRIFNHPLRHLEINDLLEVTIHPTEGQERIEVSGPGNLLDKITTASDGGVVRMGNENTCNFVRDLGIRMKADCYVNSLNSITYNGQGNVTFADTLHTVHFKFETNEAAGDVSLLLKADSLNIICHTGLSHFDIVGTTRIAQLFNQGFGRMNAADLQAEVMLARNGSINDMWVRSSAYLFALITGSGDLFYAGEPADVDVEITGSGALIEVGG